MFYFVCTLGLIACLDEAKTICDSKKNHNNEKFHFESISAADDKGKTYNIICAPPHGIMLIEANKK